MGYTEEELALLSDEEREAIAAGSPEAERDLLAAVAGDGDGDEDGSGDGDGAGDVGGDASASAGDGAAATGATGAATDGAPAADNDGDEVRSSFVPKYHAPAVEDYTTRIQSLDQAFQDGTLELVDYNRQRDELVRAQLKAEISAEQNAQVEEQLWAREISDFMDAHKEYKESKFRHAALDIAVKDLAADEANADKPGRWFLREAHKIVEKEFGAQAKESPEQPNNDNKPGEKQSRKPDLSGVPKTLAHLPAAELPDTGSVDEFAHLDRLTGLELEQAVARLSPAERERYRTAA